MGTKADSESKTIVKKLSLYLPGFYILYYVWSVILIAALKEDWDELGRLPFRIRKSEFTPAHHDAALASWMAMVLTYTTSLLLTYGVVKATRKSWDYVVTTSIVHLIVCIIVNQAFPVNWVWWLTIIVASGVVSVVAEFVNYFLRDMREIKLDHV